MAVVIGQKNQEGGGSESDQVARRTAHQACRQQAHGDESGQSEEAAENVSEIKPIDWKQPRGEGEVHVEESGVGIPRGGLHMLPPALRCCESGIVVELEIA